ncbi:MAG: pantoate--beta-alanine ligase [Verrucomicrobia bacterium]|nr:pantoate--beta-alanine ligase [Verrucomicrobiota bacterium]
MKILRSPSSAARVCRGAPRPVVFVPTMGALHEGHLSLIRRARQLAGPHGTVAVSIFVNPTQFGPKEDLSRYPRPIKEDMAQCRAAGVDLLFLPEAGAFYASDHSTWVDEALLSAGLCGAARPGHFRGVCTVVAKLFNLVAPEIAVFGKKDAQQLAIIRRMVRDLNFQIKIVGVETHREADGLAMSSRNRYLSEEERAQAPILRRALLEAHAAAKAGGATPAKLRARVVKTIQQAPLARIDYVEAVDAETLGKPTGQSRKLLIAVAVVFGKTRLIDNIEVSIR